MKPALKYIVLFVLVVIVSSLTTYFTIYIYPRFRFPQYANLSQARNGLAKLNIQYDYGSFLKAARCGDMVAVGLFLNAGMTPDIGDEHDTALTYAIDQYHPDIIKLLIVKGADVNLDHFPEGRPLWCAVRKGQADTVKYLIAKGAKVNFKNTSFGRGDYSLLKFAIDKGDPEIVTILRQAGAKELID